MSPYVLICVRDNCNSLLMSRIWLRLLQPARATSRNSAKPLCFGGRQRRGGGSRGLVGSHSPPTAITIHNHLRRFPVEREEQSRGREGGGETGNDGKNWSSKGSEIKVKCNGERVPPTVLMSSGRVNRFQGKTAGWSVSSHSHSFLSVSVTPLGDVNLGLVRPQPGHKMISGKVKSLIGRICICANVSSAQLFLRMPNIERSQTI